MWKCQSILSMSYHFAPIGMAIIFKKQETSVGDDVGKLERSCLAGGNVKWSSCCSQRRAAVPQKHRINIGSTNSTAGYRPERTENWDSNRYLYTNDHNILISNSQKVETNPMSIATWMDKQNVVCVHNGTLSSLKKEGNSDICYNMDEPWRHYAQWNQPDAKVQILYNSTYMKYLE